MQQPPPRKVKHTAVLRKTHSEQLSKLQQKHQHESELLEDIRTFTKERAAIEKHYAQALCKLAQQYLAKRHQFPQTGDSKEGHKNEDGSGLANLAECTYRSFDEDTDSFGSSEDTFDDDFASRPNTPEDMDEEGRPIARTGSGPPTMNPNVRTLNTVWKTVLEETDRVGRSRLQGADSYMQAISEAIKPVKATKGNAAKKVFERTAVIQKEITQSVNEMVRSHKIYHEDEHLSHEARTKALEVDAKLKNKNTGLFTSMSTLQKNSQKLNSRRETCEVKSTSARNEYLLNLAAANAHQIRYYSTDIPNLLQMLDGEMYERIRECFIVFARTELECCGLTQECFTKIMSDAGLISRQFNLDCFLHDNLVFTDLMQYKFEPTDNDEDNTVSAAHQAEEQVQKEARKWATKVAKETNAIRQYNRQLQQLQEEMLGAGKPSDSEKKDEKEKEKDSEKEKVSPEVQIEELQENIRKAETAKMKAEARIDALRMGGIDVDDWLKRAHAESYVEEEDPAPRSSTSMSMKSDSSAEQSSAQRSRNESAADDPEPVNTSMPNDSTYINYQEEDDIDETFESGTITATPRPAETTEETAADTNSTGYSSGRNYPMRCMAVYDFQASNSDEVSLTEGEHLQIIGDGDGDGWVRALRDDGSSGLVPENYIQFLENGNLPDEYEVNVDGDLPVMEDPSAERVSAYSATDYEVQKAMTPEGPQSPASPPASEGPWVRALYDYEATSEEELSFQEGQFIRIIRKDEDGVDDGWWEGEVNGRVGVFPSLVVEEITGENGGGDNLGVVSPVGTGPPPYTPPEPGPLPPQLEITHPTPSDEHAPSEPGRSPDGTNDATDPSGGDGTEPASGGDGTEPASGDPKPSESNPEETTVDSKPDGSPAPEIDTETEEPQTATEEPQTETEKPQSETVVPETSDSDLKTEEADDDLPPPPPPELDVGPDGDGVPDEDDSIPEPPPEESDDVTESVDDAPAEAVVKGDGAAEAGEADADGVKPPEASSDMTIGSDSLSSPTNDISSKPPPADPKVIHLLNLSEEGEFDDNAESII